MRNERVPTSPGEFLFHQADDGQIRLPKYSQWVGVNVGLGYWGFGDFLQAALARDDFGTLGPRKRGTPNEEETPNAF